MRKRKKYSPIQKPRPLHLERIMNLKRWTGILLICAAAFMALALFVMWGLPVLFPPEDPEDSLPQATVPPTASPAASTEENDLPVLEDSVNLFVINEDHPADAGFAPEETAEFDSVTVDARIVPALTALCDAAKADGVTLKFSGGYVSYAEQESLYNAEVERLIAAGSTKIMAREDAKSTVSAPGTSDLQSGLCVTCRTTPQRFRQRIPTAGCKETWRITALCSAIQPEKRMKPELNAMILSCAMSAQSTPPPSADSPFASKNTFATSAPNEKNGCFREEKEKSFLFF